jgi:hypothetical protein
VRCEGPANLRQFGSGKAAMISTGMARAYSGSAKPGPCQPSLAASLYQRTFFTLTPSPSWCSFPICRPLMHQTQHRLYEHPIVCSTRLQTPSCAPGLQGADGGCSSGSSPHSAQRREAHTIVSLPLSLVMTMTMTMTMPTPRQPCICHFDVLHLAWAARLLFRECLRE